MTNKEEQFNQKERNNKKKVSIKFRQENVVRIESDSIVFCNEMQGLQPAVQAWLFG